jgi:hypothetical protein
MSILLVLGVLVVAAVVAAIRSVALDGYRRMPVRSGLRGSDHAESDWSWR